MFGFHVNREWAARGAGSRPPIKAQVEAARARFESLLAGAARCATAQDAGFAFQIFLAGPRSMKFSVSVSEAHSLRDYVRASNRLGAPLWGVAHGTYFDTPWDTSKDNYLWKTKFIKQEVKRAASAGLAGLVIHLGTPPPEQVLQTLPWLIPDDHMRRPKPGEEARVVVAAGGVDTLAADPEADAEDQELEHWGCFIKSDSVRQRDARSASGGRLNPECVRLFLEVPHVLPKNSHYETPAKLCALFRQIREKVDPNLCYFGLCIDTAHVWACGADIASFEGASQWLAELEACHDVIPPRAIVFHLNDNRHGRGSGLDEHDPLLMGAIWGDYAQCPEKSGLAAFLDYARRYCIPTILERKERKAGNELSDQVLSAPEAIAADLGVLEAMAHF